MTGWLSRIVLIAVVVAGVASCARYNKAPVESRPHGRSSVPIPMPAYYRVRRGDTLFEIAWRYNLDFRRLAEWNGIRKPYTIYPGQRLRLHPPRKGHARPVPPRSPPVAQPRAPRRPARTAPARLQWAWPTRGKIVQRFQPGSQTSKGIRIAGRVGQTIRTAEGGKVVYAGGGLRGYGKLIIINHNNNYLSAYGFVRGMLVKERQKVTKGQKIAEMGTAPDGRAMLHFEIRRNGKPVDPLSLLPRVR